MKQAKQIVRDALLLTAAAFLMRTAGVSFGVAVSRRAGPEAMGLFSLISGVYGFALTLATSGIQLGTTRVVTETVSRGNSARVRAILRRAIAYALVCGTAAALLLFFGAGLIGTRFLSDARTVRPLRLFAVVQEEKQPDEEGKHLRSRAAEHQKHADALRAFRRND